jgi:hypothetical protein
MYFNTINFSLPEIKFIENILSDKRAWKTKFIYNDQKPDIVVIKVSKKIINEIFKDYPHLHNLSVCDSTRKPIKIYICTENWNLQPLISGYQNLYSYRTYLILHEFGHALGYGHEKCPGKNHPAPIMMQQTLGTGQCYPDPWVQK